MKRLITLLIMLTLMSFSYSQQVSALSDEIAQDLDLSAVAMLYAESSSVEDFEHKLNDKTIAISNIDLNMDGQVDYLRCVESVDGLTHYIIVQSCLAQDIYQDIVTIVSDKNIQTDEVTTQLVGNEFIYGTNYIIEPVYLYRPVIYSWFWSVNWVSWYSPYYWGYYPHWYSYWHHCHYDIYHQRMHDYHRHHYCSYHHHNHTRYDMQHGEHHHGYANSHRGSSFNDRHSNDGSRNYRDVVIRHPVSNSGSMTRINRGNAVGEPRRGGMSTTVTHSARTPQAATHRPGVSQTSSSRTSGGRSTTVSGSPSTRSSSSSYHRGTTTSRPSSTTTHTPRPSTSPTPSRSSGGAVRSGSSPVPSRSGGGHSGGSRGGSPVRSGSPSSGRR